MATGNKHITATVMIIISKLFIKSATLSMRDRYPKGGGFFRIGNLLSGSDSCSIEGHLFLA